MGFAANMGYQKLTLTWISIESSKEKVQYLVKSGVLDSRGSGSTVPKVDSWIHGFILNYTLYGFCKVSHLRWMKLREPSQVPKIGGTSV